MPYIGQGLQQGRRQRSTFTATASQTTFAHSYTVGYVDVYQNGILLAPSDYTATNGTQIVLSVGAALNDEITIISQHLFSVADVVSASGGTFSGNVTVTGNLTVQGSTIAVDTATVQTVDLGDNDKIRLGDGNDLQMYHDGTDSYISNKTGDLYIGGNADGDVGGDVYIRSKIGENDTSIRLLDDSSFSMYQDGSQAINIATNFIQVLGNRALKLEHTGGSPELIFNHNNGNETKLIGSGTGARVITLPDATGTVSLLTNTETLTNKTLTTPVINGFSGTGNGTITGNLNIGTATPEYPLQVSGTNVSSGGGLATLGIYDSGTAYDGTNPGGGITFRGKYNNAGALTNFATVQGVKENTTDGNYASALRFTTRENGGNLTEHMRIASNGVVTFKTDATFNNGDNFVIASFMPATTGGESSGMLFGHYPADGYAKQGIFWERYVGASGSGGRGKLHFVNRDATDTSVPTTADTRMTIDEAGNVGIGTASPDKTLTVRGTSGDVVQAKIIYAGSDGNRSGLILQNTHTGGREYGLYAGNDSTGAGLGNSLGIMDNTAGAYRLIINSSGNVDIGSSSGTTSVRINANARSNTGLNVGGASTTATGIYVDNSDGGATLDIATLGSAYGSHGASAGEVWFYSPDNINIGGATSSTNEVRILGSGGIRHNFYNTGYTADPNDAGTFHFKGKGGNQLSIITAAYTAGAGTNIAQANVQIVNSAFGALVFVAGYNAPGYPGAQFCDLVYFGYNASPTILAQQTIAGSPPNRTYTGSGYALYLSYSSNVLTTKVNCIQSHS